VDYAELTENFQRMTGMDRWQQVVCDLDNADDISLVEISQTVSYQLTRKIERTLRSVGLHMNAKNARLWSAVLGRTIQQ